MIDFCMQTDNLLAEITMFQRAGIDMSEPIPLSRVRPDGYELSWLVSVHPGRYQGVVPFLIEDKTRRDERVPRENKHRNQVTGISSLTIAVDDVATICRWYSSILQADESEINCKELDAAGSALRDRAA